MLKNSKVRNLENTILSVVAKSNSELDLSSISMKSDNSTNIIKRSVNEAKKLVLLCCDTPEELLDNANLENQIKIVTKNNDISKRLSDADNTKLEVLLTENYDLKTNPSLISNYLKENPTIDLSAYRTLQSIIEEQRKTTPLISDSSIDTVIVDIDINTLDSSRVNEVITEAFRVLEKGGKILIRMIIADEPCDHLLSVSVKEYNLKTIPLEKEIINIMDQAGFHGIQFECRSELPVKVIGGVELREFVISAYKGKQGPCIDCGQSVIYRGPWKEVVDDDGHRYVRGERVAVCSKTYGVVNRNPYKDQFIYVPCYVEIPEESAQLFDCNTPKIRDIHVTKGLVGVTESKEEIACLTSCDCGCDC
ncbi:hypothetical protein [Clostridium sp. DJ247]|uniref:hypothetical protein n=1 Tax=Clostridium sp. DJ247 TaxID=2726188 RepID=UPI00162419E9|nr:hypothetical protein [Clostridium sp. DJ247]MBC2579036.1 hypothetical protein [Clostridium sp. DJ247]